MASSKTALTALRLLAFAGTVVVFVLGMWSLVIIQAIESRGERALATHLSRLGASAPSWSLFVPAAMQGTARTWMLVVASLIASFTILIVIMSNRYYWLRISPPLVLLLESACTICTTITFCCALSLSLSLSAFNTRPLDPLDSAELSFFALLRPLSKGLIITTCTAVCLLTTTFTAHLISHFRRRAKAKDIRSFEPTVSALGMRGGFHALHPPPRARLPIPTVYDSYTAFWRGEGAWRPEGALQTEGAQRLETALQPEAALRPRLLPPGMVPSTKQVGYADEGAWIARRKTDSRWSVSTASPRGVEGDIMRLLEGRKTIDLKKSRRAVPVRPASAVWNGRDGVHAM